MPSVTLLPVNRVAGNDVVPASVSVALTVFSSRSAPVYATLFNVPPLLEVNSDDPALTTLPPVIVPPAIVQLPVPALRVRVSPVFVIVPVMFTVPPVRVKPAKLNPPVVNVPPSASVAPLIVT